ncbi:MAG: hypothetical protein ACTSP4_02190 [Candidatus Hodarchaeales archaeon]
MGINRNREISSIISSLEDKYNKGEITSEEYAKLKQKYEKQLSADKKSSKLQFDLIEVSGSAKITAEYVNVSGDARIEGYMGRDTLKISGTGKISNDEIFISGSGKIPGNVKTGFFRSSGSVKVSGDLVVNTLDSSGSLKVVGSSEMKQVKISGSTKFLADVKVEEEFDSSGSLKINGTLKSFDIRLSGSFDVGEIESTGLFYAKINGRSRTRKIIADTVMVESPRGSILKVDEIIATGSVELENVRAQKVTGERVRLYGECRIGQIIETREK